MCYTVKGMQKKKIIIGNWKMNPVSVGEAEKLFNKIAKSVSRIKKTEVVICPPFIYLDKLAKIRTSKIKLGAQNAFYEERGAYTGEISPEMLYNFGIRHVIVGHSKRRELGETNKEVSQKIRTALLAGLTPILCVGESSRDESHDYFQFIKTQTVESLDGVFRDSISKIIITYEPIWSISTTPNHKNATPHDSLEMSLFIKKTLVDKFGVKIKIPRIIYGGDVNEKNARDFLQDGGVDGVLIGRASLDAKKFAAIITIAENIK